MYSEWTGKIDELIEALQIFRKYSSDLDSIRIRCDEEAFAVYLDPSLVSANDLDRLNQLGFYFNKNRPQFFCFNFQ